MGNGQSYSNNVPMAHKGLEDAMHRRMKSYTVGTLVATIFNTFIFASILFAWIVLFSVQGLTAIDIAETHWDNLGDAVDGVILPTLLQVLIILQIIFGFLNRARYESLFGWDGSASWRWWFQIIVSGLTLLLTIGALIWWIIISSEFLTTADITITAPAALAGDPADVVRRLQIYLIILVVLHFITSFVDVVLLWLMAVSTEVKALEDQAERPRSPYPQAASQQLQSPSFPAGRQGYV